MTFRNTKKILCDNSLSWEDIAWSLRVTGSEQVPLSSLQVVSVTLERRNGVKTSVIAWISSVMTGPQFGVPWVSDGFKRQHAKAKLSVIWLQLRRFLLVPQISVLWQKSLTYPIPGYGLLVVTVYDHRTNTTYGVYRDACLVECLYLFKAQAIPSSVLDSTLRVVRLYRRNEGQQHDMHI